MEKKVFILLCIAAVFFAVAVGVTVWAVQINNALNETSKELEEINKWIEEKNIHREGENVVVGKILIKNGSSVVIGTPYEFNKEEKTWTSLRSIAGLNENNELFINVSNWDLANGTEIKQWNCTGEECLSPILRDIEDKGDYYEYNGVWLRKDISSATLFHNMNDNTTMSTEIKFDEDKEIAIIISNYNDSYTKSWYCSGADCLNMT